MKQKTLRFWIVNGVLALLALACLLVCLALSDTLESQKAARRWAGEGDTAFAQLSCFLSGDDALTLGDIYTFRQTLTTKLTEASMEAPENGSLFTDAWSSSGKLTAAGDNGSAETPVTAVGGNWFFFHPLRLLSGSYIAEDDMMDDRVVLDRELAWRLFGGVELAGMTVTIGADAKPFVVAGVVERERDFASKKANTGETGLYMSYRAWEALTADAAEPVECYEIVLPQPVDGFAENLVRENFKMGGGELVNNTKRYALGGVWKIIREFGTRSMHLNNVIYPDWENAARCFGDWCALFLALSIALAVCPAVTAFVTALVLLVRGKDRLAQKLPALASGAVDRLRQRRWARDHGTYENNDRTGEAP